MRAGKKEEEAKSRNDKINKLMIIEGGAGKSRLGGGGWWKDITLMDFFLKRLPFCITSFYIIICYSRAFVVSMKGVTPDEGMKEKMDNNMITFNITRKCVSNVGCRLE